MSFRVSQLLDDARHVLAVLSRLAELQVEQHLGHLLLRSVVLLEPQHLGESCLAAMDVCTLPFCAGFEDCLDFSLVVSDFPASGPYRISCSSSASTPTSTSAGDNSSTPSPASAGPPSSFVGSSHGSLLLFCLFQLHAGLILQLMCCLLPCLLASSYLDAQSTLSHLGPQTF